LWIAVTMPFSACPFVGSPPLWVGLHLPVWLLFSFSSLRLAADPAAFDAAGTANGMWADKGLTVRCPTEPDGDAQAADAPL
jgi:hypothetical protein